MKKALILFALITFIVLQFPGRAFAQWLVPGDKNEYIDINNIKALQLLNGDMWHSADSDLSRCEFPRASGKHINHEGGIWLSGSDPNGIIHNAAAFRRKDKYFDFIPGPYYIDTPATWNQVWKINRSDITTFISRDTHTLVNVPLSIRNWPAKGNNRAVNRLIVQSGGSSTYTIQEDLAPFTDVDHDGIYNPYMGDYPQIKGDQMLWWIISDGGPHERTNGYPMGIEIHASAYAYKRGTLIDNVVFYEYDIFNRSPYTYDNFRFGIYADAALGDGNDDYAGFDYAHRMAVTYNGSPADGNGQNGTYGTHPPMTGITLLEAPGDNNGIYRPAGSFMMFNDDLSANGAPINNVEYNYLMHAQQRDGNHLTVSCGAQAGQPANYAYTGAPGDAAGWSECSCNNTPGDRRFVLATDDYILPAGAHVKVAFALVATDTSGNHTCPGASFADIAQVADTAWQWYKNPHTPQGVNNIAAAQKKLTLWPNPAQHTLFIETPENTNGLLQVYDALGRIHEVQSAQKNNTISLNIEPLPAGVYTISYQTKDSRQSGIFVKQ